VDVESIPQQPQEKTAPVDSADLVVGLLTALDHAGMQAFYQGFHALPGSPRIVVLHGEPASATAAAIPQAVEGNSSVSLLPWSLMNSDPSTPVQSISAACRSLFAATEKLGAKGCCLVASEMESATPDWVCQLLSPLLESEMDLVIPYYTPHKWQGLLNSSILYPLIRSLYGKRVRNPLGPDVGVSRRLAQKLAGATRNGNAGAEQMHPLASLTPMSVCDNLQVCQVRIGSRVYPPTDWMNMSSLVAQVLGPIFLEMERGAPCWQRTRGSVSVPARGEPRSLPEDAGAADINIGRMLETFQLGVRDLQEIWSLVLPPATLFELRKLSRLTPDKFTMPDELWARIVYDFALAHRLRTINRDHLLRSMTPLYLAWVGSYTRELQAAGPAAVEQRIERLALAYEAAKPYLISRWRWPDRFNP
jgi:glucosylglycerate synthase